MQPDHAEPLDRDIADHLDLDDPGVEQPRISIVHLMTWTAGCAILLTAYQALYQPSGVDEKLAIALRINTAMVSILYGTGVAGLILWVKRRVGGGPAFPTQPGHWLLLTLGMYAVVQWIAWAGFLSFQAICRLLEWYGAMSISWYYVAQLPVHLVQLIVAVAALIGCRARWHWKAVFAAMMGAAATTILGHVIATANQGRIGVLIQVETVLNAIGPIALFALVATALSVDLIRGTSRDWLHWAGVLVNLLGFLAMWVQLFLFFVLPLF